MNNIGPLPSSDLLEKPIRAQFADTMLDVGQIDEKLVVLVGDISHFALQPFAQACPGRFYNIGILEPTSVSMCAGLSKAGFHPVFHTISPFIVERCFEQIKLDFCYHQLGGNLITVGSAFDYSNLGCTHHCYGDFALLKTLQNIEIVYPGSAIEFDCLFKEAYRNSQLTVYRIPGTPHRHPIGRDQISIGDGIKCHDGDNLTLIATGPQLRSAIDAIPALSDIGWRPEVIYIHTIRPLDDQLVIDSIRKTGRAVVIEEHMKSGGLADEVRRTLPHSIPAEIESIAIPDTFVTGYGSYTQHCANLGLTPEGIVERVKSVWPSPLSKPSVR